MSFEDGYQVPALEKDGKLLVTPYPATEGYKTWFTGAGDQFTPTIVRGGGTRMKLQWDAVEARGAKHVDVQFAEPVEMHDGSAQYTPIPNWGVDDLMTVRVVMPATATTVSGSGNCNRVPTGLGYDLLVPAPGDGGHEVDLATAVPVPDVNNQGFWNVDHDSGVIIPGAPGASGFHLLSVEVVANYLRNVALGHPLGIFEIDAYKAEWVHPRWIIRISVDKQSAEAGNFTAWLLCYRKNLT